MGCRRLLWRRPLGRRRLRRLLLLHGIMVPDRTAGRSTEQRMVTRDVARHATNRGTSGAARPRSGRGGKRRGEQTADTDYTEHGDNAHGGISPV